MTAPSANTRVVFIAGGGTGGHLMPALAIATELRRQRPDLEPVLIGAERGIEARLLPTRDFRYHLLPSEPIYRRQWWKNFRWPFLFLGLIRRVGKLFDQEKPAFVIGTGGYASGPVVWYATRRGIPCAMQEQNAYPGLVTRLLAKRVNQLFLGLPEARKRLALGTRTQVIDSGNPIPPPEHGRRKAALARFNISERDGPVLLVTGGSQGSVAVNDAVARWIESGGARGVQLIWATGRGSYENYKQYHSPPAIQVFDFLDPIADAYAVADLVVGRAGMMTGAELCAWGLPSVMIPLPTAAEDHQRHNAEALAQAGAAEMILQKDLTPHKFAQVVGGLLHDPVRLQAMAAAARLRGKPAAAGEIVAHLLALPGV
jgi:UDP-N-acetylglucosamine--N-acetylmuramyl-(pentapeptide) pyrophosphoryl-undecaprenol N-acetylglucosamine transferase